MHSSLNRHGSWFCNTGIPFPQRNAHEKSLGWEHRFTCHTFRYAFATYHYEDGTDLLTLKALMGHRSISSTAIYIHLSSHTLTASASPFDRMGGMLHG